MTTKAPNFMQRSRVSKPSVIVFKDKYCNRIFLVNNCTRIFLVNNDEDLDKVALKILKERIEDESISNPGKWEQPNECPPKQDIDRLPEGSVKKFALDLWTRNRDDYNSWLTEVDTYKTAQLAIKEQDGRMAFTIISERDGDYENEGFEIIPLETL